MRRGRLARMPATPGIARSALLGLVTWVSLAACGDTMAPAPLPTPDLAAFTADVQPILERRCGNPTCHGDEGRPLALYAPRANRANPADVFRDPPLTDAELRANFDRVLGFCAPSGSGTIALLAKPLAESVSGVWHAGGDIFATSEDREYQALEVWLRGEPAPPQ